MREIKFRVWDKNIPTLEQSIRNKKPSGEMINWDYVINSDYLIDGINGKYPIMQYTGLKDKDGKEIYEGDIIKSTYSKDKIYAIEWREGTTTPFNMPYYAFGDDFEVLGNIYENPELIEK